MIAKTYDLTTHEGLEAFSELVGPQAARAIRIGMAYGMGPRKLREQARDNVLCSARYAVLGGPCLEAEMTALNVACRCGVVFG